MNTDRSLLLRYLEGALPEDAARRLEDQLAASPALREKLQAMQALRGSLADARADSFEPYFADRVVARLTATPRADGAAFYDALQALFLRTALAVLLVVVVLGAVNQSRYEALGVTSTVSEAILGLPSADLMDALSYESF